MNHRQNKWILGLLLLAQCAVIARWQWDAHLTGIDWVDLPLALLTGLGIDCCIVSTAFHAKHNRWSMATSIAALATSVMIALDYFMALHFIWLHASYPVLVYAFSNHLATNQGVAKIVRQRKAKPITNDSADTATSQQEALQSTVALESTVYRCKTCNHALPNKQSFASANRLDYCRYCKGLDTLLIHTNGNGVHDHEDV
jgi:hypothetical protein